MRDIQNKAIFKFMLRRGLGHKRYARLNYLDELSCGYSKAYALRCLKRELKLSNRCIMTVSRIDQLRAIARQRPLTKTEQIELSNLISDDLNIGTQNTDNTQTIDQDELK